MKESSINSPAHSGSGDILGGDVVVVSDRELLGLAAKAAGYEVRWHESWQCFVHVGPFNTDSPPTLAGQRMPWAPLDDDGDALRLAVKLRINVEHMKTMYGKTFGVNCWPAGRGDCGVTEEEDLADYDAATRRAIVRAAAAIGAGMTTTATPANEVPADRSAGAE